MSDVALDTRMMFRPLALHDTWKLRITLPIACSVFSLILFFNIGRKTTPTSSPRAGQATDKEEERPRSNAHATKRIVDWTSKNILAHSETSHHWLGPFIFPFPHLSPLSVRTPLPPTPPASPSPPLLCTFFLFLPPLLPLFPFLPSTSPSLPSLFVSPCCLLGGVASVFLF